MHGGTEIDCSQNFTVTLSLRAAGVWNRGFGDTQNEELSIRMSEAAFLNTVM